MLPALASESALDGFLQTFRDGTLARGEWTHAAHVAGVANTETSGYHETLTRFWVVRIGETMERGRDRLEAVREAVARYGEDSGLFRRYYSFDVVRSAAARREWMEPDLPG